MTRLVPLLLALILPAPVFAIPADSAAVVSSAPLVRAPHPDLARPAARSPNLTLQLEGPREIPNVNRLLWRPRPRKLNDFHRTLYSADQGAYSALAVGYLGWLAGAWEEDTALWLMGAGAAVGAVLGTITGDLPVSVGVGTDDRP